MMPTELTFPAVAGEMLRDIFEVEEKKRMEFLFQLRRKTRQNEEGAFVPLLEGSGVVGMCSSICHQIANQPIILEPAKLSLESQNGNKKLIN